jgi:hypothetical protein
MGDTAFLRMFSKGKSAEERQRLREVSLGPPYLACDNDMLGQIDPDGREPITVAITVYTIGRGISHLILACYNCRQAYQCNERATALMNHAASLFDDGYDFQNWLRTTRPGSECAELWADCGKEALLGAKWIVGGVIVKYGIRFAHGYGRP